MATAARPSSSVAAKTKTHLAPKALQGLEVLALPVASLPEYIEQAAESNPLIEIDFSDGLFSYSELPESDECDVAPASGDCSSFDRFPESTPPLSRCERSLTPSFEWDFSRIQDECRQTETLQEYLHVQTVGMRLPDGERRLMDALIECVSDDGYFVGDLSMVAFACGVSIEAAARGLRRLQSLQPAGVGARDLSECLLLQVQDDDPYAPMLRTLVRRHLEDVAANRLSSIARSLGVSTSEAGFLCRAVADMNPRPGASFWQRSDARYIVPDIVIRRRGTDFTVEVTGSIGPGIGLNAEYLAMMDEGGLGEQARAYLEEKRKDAEVFLRSIEQRGITLHRFGVFLVEKQFRFFISSDGGLAPLTMKQAADALDVHVSTISRTVQGKYAQTPRGTFPLKMFFTRALPQNKASSGKGSVSSFDIKERIRAIIAEEDPEKPLSDSAITDRLNAEGIEVKRRTVAKYRESIGIESQAKRRMKRA